ncbi:hypothetical protein MATL_G00125290 [Megalops atlanticus]|uniref:CABIT domain-containing protein n=1 Tax=Megalops atlanticus TaxID=7932 RepID=A0A9D3PVE1_MEGAT|nr:hypothetical protein MATL_G00125290 [Megalops atlanticus]
MQAAGADTLSLQEYVASVDKTTLPRILQVCSGVYFQGSVYELSGSEVCLSTGDLVKIIGLERQSATCEDISTKETSELPLDYSGLFRLVPEDIPFCSIEEMVSLVPTEADACDSFSFTCRHQVTLEGCTVEAGEVVTMLSVESRDREEGHARCRLRDHTGAPQDVLIPLSCRGEFYENDNGHSYSLQEILATPRLLHRRFRHSKASRCGGPLVLSIVYQVQAIMHLRKNVVKFPSSLEVEVVDVTEQSQDVEFVTPLSLAEVALQPEQAFPAVAEILEGPEAAQSLFRCGWLPALHKGRLLVLHGAGDSPVVLASSFKGKKERQYFLLSQRYGGSLRRRPRDFASVYELYAASLCHPGLRVSVSKHCEAPEESLPSLSVGDQLEVLSSRKMELTCDGEKQAVEVLVCNRMPEEEDDEEEDEDRGEEIEEVCLPMFLEGHFVEKITDNKKYSLGDLCKRFTLPLDVKVAKRDTGMESDPLAGFSALRLEEASVEPTVRASLPDKPDLCFELPVRWLTMSLSFTKDPLPWPPGQPPELRWETVTEVTDNFYYEFRKLTGCNMAPPPRPPKRRVSTEKPPRPATKSSSSPRPDRPHSKSHTLSQDMGQLKLSDWTDRSPLPPPPDISDEAPPLIPRKPNSKPSSRAPPNTYVQTPKSKSGKRKKDKERYSDSDHDYEMIDMVKKAQESVMFY